MTTAARADRRMAYVTPSTFAGHGMPCRYEQQPRQARAEARPGLVGPAHEDGAGGVTGADRDKENEVALAQALLFDGVN